MIPETPVIPEIPLSEFPEKDSSNSSKSLDTGILESPKTGGGKAGGFPVIENDPLACPNVRRLLLSEAASRYLEATGEGAFVIISKASYPATPGRWAIFLAPCPLATAAAACDVLTGKARAVRIMPPKPGKADPPATVSDRQPGASAGNVSATAGNERQTFTQH